MGCEDQGWVAWFIIAALTGQTITVYGDGKQVRDLLWVDDLIDAYELAVQRIDKAAGQAFNIGGGPERAISVNEVIREIAGHVGGMAEPSQQAWRPGDQRVFVSAIDKAEEILGWRPKVNPADGIPRLIEWARENEDLLASLSGRSLAKV